MIGLTRRRSILVLTIGLAALPALRGQSYKVQAPTVERNLTIFPVTADKVFDTGILLTLDEGIRSGDVVVEETGQSRGLIRPRHPEPRIWPEQPFPLPPSAESPSPSPQVNELSITNRANRPLLLLAGEIVVGGKQDRVIAKDRVIPGHSGPVQVDVFCVEPHRWTSTSAGFGSLADAIAQPSVRTKAMAAADQQEVWRQVAKSRAAFAAMASPAAANAIAGTSSYATAIETDSVRRQLDALAGPTQQSYEEFLKQLRARQAVGVVVAVDQELIFADVFASPGLLEKYWPKLIRSYAAEAITPHIRPSVLKFPPTVAQAQAFLNKLGGRKETVETEPGVYRYTEIAGEDFDAFILNGLLPNLNFNVHLAKMKR